MKKSKSGRETETGLRSLLAISELRGQFSELEQHFSNVRTEVDELHDLTSKLLDVGVAISSEIDLYTLLTRIIEEAKRLLRADKGTLYLADRRKNELWFHVTDEAQLKKIRLPINEKSISGYVAMSMKLLNIEDVYEIGKETPYRFNYDIDSQTGYRTCSMLTVPMLNHQGEITGVVQLINKMRDGKVMPFTPRDERILMSLASQAAVAIENAQLYKEIADLFEALIQYSASAIDERDPATAGHSRRVAMYSVATARAMGRFTDEEIKELEYAAWLHDVGKIGVREHILVKENKLYPEQLERIRERFRAAELSVAVRAEIRRRKLAATDNKGKIKEINRWVKNEIQELENDLKFIERVNTPGSMDAESKQRINEIARKSFAGPGGEKIFYLTPEEKHSLAVERGNLTDAEKKDMNSHAIKTYRILSQFPFTRRLADVPQIAASHHERLDGSGYPNHKIAPEIPVQSRILALADVFDALVAQDRPYKPAIPVNRALKILDAEVKAGRMDGDVFKVFVEHKVYKLKDYNYELTSRLKKSQ
ncbi:MAG: HD domain-containing phosphohydrolase [bacterium]